MKLKRPGQRILKTSLAVFLSFVCSNFRSSDALPFYSAIAAIICVKPDINDSINVGINRIIGTIIGGICGFLYLLFLKSRVDSEIVNYFFVSLVVAFLIWLMSVLNMPKAISIMAIVFCSISINYTGESLGAIEFALNRTLDTLVGVVIAIFINSIDFELTRFSIFKKYNEGYKDD